MSGPANPEAAWRALALHQEAMQLQAVCIRFSALHPEAAEIAAPRIHAEVNKERRTKWEHQTSRRRGTPSTTSSASAKPTKRAKQRT